MNRTKPWICLIAYNEHMRLDIPDNVNTVDELAKSPQSVAQPVGWKTLLELGPREVTISTKCLSRCPHCQQTGVRLPLGIEGYIVGKSVLMTDPELRSFSIEKQRGEDTARATSDEAHRAWIAEQPAPPLGADVGLSQDQLNLLGEYIQCIPPGESEYDKDI